MPRILGRERAYPRSPSCFYKAVFQAVPLFGAETSVVTLYIECLLVTFHDGVTRSLAGMQPQILTEKS